MNRLLFAAARGARIEVELLDGVWIVSRKVPYTKLQKCESLYRIHPDDAHLQYGPISTALRDESRRELVQADIFPVIRYGVFWLRTDDHALYSIADQLERSLFLLILAEALADEGL